MIVLSATGRDLSVRFKALRKIRLTSLITFDVNLGVVVLLHACVFPFIIFKSL